MSGMSVENLNHTVDNESSRIAAQEWGDRVSVHDVFIEDPYKDDNFDYISGIVDERTREGFYGDSDINDALARRRTSQIDRENPSTKQLLGEFPGFGDWLDLVPTAAALDPIYSPDIKILANGKEFTPQLRMWMSNLYDAMGIRSRAEVMKQLIVDEVMQSDEPQQWASLACGAARPVFDSLTTIDEKGGRMPNVTLADYERGALKNARAAADEAGLSENVSTRRMNILKPNGISYDPHQWGAATNMLAAAAGRLPKESYDMIDAVGILEYLGRDDWPYMYNGVIKKNHPMAGAVSFLHNAYELVKPGGMLVVGNMRDTHPQLGFTLNVAQWPHIQPRSIEEMLSIIREAGLDGDVDVQCPSDNVYALYAIRKDM